MKTKGETTGGTEEMMKRLEKVELSVLGVGITLLGLILLKPPTSTYWTTLGAIAALFGIAVIWASQTKSQDIR